MTTVNIAANESEKPAPPSTPSGPQKQQQQNDPKPAGDKLGNQQK